MTTVNKEAVEPKLKDFSITIEKMFVGKTEKLCLIVRYLDKEAEKYVMFESQVPKSSVLGKEVETIIKEAKKVLKDTKKIKK